MKVQFAGYGTTDVRVDTVPIPGKILNHVMQLLRLRQRRFVVLIYLYDGSQR